MSLYRFNVAKYTPEVYICQMSIVTINSNDLVREKTFLNSGLTCIYEDGILCISNIYNIPCDMSQKRRFGLTLYGGCYGF